MVGLCTKSRLSVEKLSASASLQGRKTTFCAKPVGRYYWNKRSSEGIRKSIESFKQAIEKDRNYALAYVGLADAYITLSSYHLARPLEVMPLARDAAVQALKLDERLAEAHASRGRIFLDYDWDWAQAEKEFQTALELKPNYANTHHWYSTLLAHLGRFDEAIREVNRALELDYLSPATSTQVGSVLYRARRYPEAIAVLQKTLDMEPNFLAARMYLGFCYLMEGKRDEAMAEFQKAHVASPNSPDAITFLIYTCALAGQREQARSYEKALDELARRQVYVSPISYAIIATGMGDMDAAFKWMEKGYEERSPSMRGLKTDPLNDPLRTDPRFASLLRRVGFEQ